MCVVFVYIIRSSKTAKTASFKTCGFDVLPFSFE
jgi:hypothetical protein